MKILSAFLSLSIILTAIIGDFVVFQSKPSKSFVFRALADNIVHASIGFLSALLFFLKVDVTREAWILNVLFCTAVSSLIDVDHFLVAKSIHFKDLTHLKQRGILHCTTLWVLITSILLIYSYIYRKMNIFVLTYMLSIAYFSHHIRDANRRGVWLYPFGHTPPIPKYIYLLILGVLPLVLAYIFNYMKPISKNTFIRYDYNISMLI